MIMREPRFYYHVGARFYPLTNHPFRAMIDHSCKEATPLSLRASDRCHWRGNPFFFMKNQRLKNLLR